MNETRVERVDRLIEDVVGISRATLPILANKPENEKTLDDQGMEFLMSGIVFMHDGNTPGEEQFAQLKQTAATSAETYRALRYKAEKGTLEEDEQSLLNLCCAFLHLYRRNVDFSKERHH